MQKSKIKKEETGFMSDERAKKVEKYFQETCETQKSGRFFSFWKKKAVAVELVKEEKKEKTMDITRREILSKSDFDKDSRRSFRKRLVILNFRHVILNSRFVILNLIQDLIKILVLPLRSIRFRIKVRNDRGGIKSGMTKRKAIQGLALKIGAGFKNFIIQVYLKIKNYKIKNFLNVIKGKMGSRIILKKAFALVTILR
jgi:hypothetical protein